MLIKRKNIGPRLLHKFPYMGGKGNLSIFYNLSICCDKWTSVCLCFPCPCLTNFKRKSSVYIP